MTPEAQRIAIAEACGWQGVPAEQTWHIKDETRYWRSVAPVGMEKDNNFFSASCVKRWLRRPDGKPFRLSMQGPIVNNQETTERIIVMEYFTDGDWEHQINPWPIVEPSLQAFSKYLPNYLTDLNAMHEAEKVLTLDQKHAYCKELRKGNVNRFSIFATAVQRAEAFLKTLNLWTTK